MRQMRWLLIVCAFAIIGGVVYLLVRDDSPAFAIDHAQPFWIEFGRGSGMDGLETVKIDQTGRVVLHQRRDVSVVCWEAGTLQLGPEALIELLEAVESNNLLGLRKAYHADILDGTQWVLWIKQGEQEKSVYFDNHFPRAITDFAAQLDAILAQAGLDEVAWQPVRGQRHDKELWDSIRR